MRHRVLQRSVERLLADGHPVDHVAYLWRRHRWAVPYATLTFVALVVLAAAIGVDGWIQRVAIGGAGAAVAANATTEFRILAATATGGLVMLRSSSIRQVAVEVLHHLPAGTPIERKGGNMVTDDWLIGDEVYTTGRRAERHLTAMADRG